MKRIQILLVIILGLVLAVNLAGATGEDEGTPNPNLFFVLDRNGLPITDEYSFEVEVPVDIGTSMRITSLLSSVNTNHNVEVHVTGAESRDELEVILDFPPGLMNCWASPRNDPDQRVICTGIPPGITNVPVIVLASQAAIGKTYQVDHKLVPNNNSGFLPQEVCYFMDPKGHAPPAEISVYIPVITNEN